MNEVELITRDRIKEMLDEKGLKYLLDTDGDYRVEFTIKDSDAILSVCFILQGTRKDVFGIQALCSRRFFSDDWPKTMKVCNEWNKDKLFGKAYLNYSEERNYATVIVEQWIDLEKGLHKELLLDYTTVIMGSINQFWNDYFDEEFNKLTEF